MRFRVLGSLMVRNGAGWVPVPAEQQRVVLAVLLTEGGAVVSTERLVDAVWAERPPRRAVNTVHAYVMRLRQRLGDEERRLIVTRCRGYELLLDRDDLDATIFEHLVSSGRLAMDTGQTKEAATRLSRALALWRGPAFADVPAIPSLTGRTAHLEQERLTAQEDRLVALLDLGRHGAVVDELFRLVEETPLREQRWALLMRALAGRGRRAEALAVFRRASLVLRSELDIAPGPQLRELRRAILTEGSLRQPVYGRRLG
ncbi:MAG TPA: AfsR/SARP family transcriptional regulator [Actinoplanes sp.]|nr:AfsR/SARP family transcriptional regulator [Actinoplanes sp.]